MTKNSSNLVFVSICVCLILSFDTHINLVRAEPITPDHYLLHEACNNALNEQVSWELYASLVYMNMAGYFGRPTVARPGFAKFFKDQASEEYEHASKFIDYINKRNGTLKRLSVEDSLRADWESPSDALSDAIKLEKHVYGKIHHLHDIADLKCQDNHLIDFLEGYFFTEQVDSINELQEMLTTLNVADRGAATLIEYMEDVKLRSSDKKEEL